MKEVTLQQAGEKDIPVILDIEKRATTKIYRPLGDAETVLRVMGKGPIFLIKSGDTAVGAVGYYEKEGGMYISVLAIDPNYQRQGFAREGMRQILEKIKDTPKIWLVTHPENAASIGLYESLSFKITEMRENYFGNGEPRVVMILEQ